MQSKHFKVYAYKLTIVTYEECIVVDEEANDEINKNIHLCI